MREKGMTATKKQALERVKGAAVLLLAVGLEPAEPADSCAVVIQPNARSPAPESYARIS